MKIDFERLFFISMYVALIIVFFKDKQWAREAKKNVLELEEVCSDVFKDIKKKGYLSKEGYDRIHEEIKEKGYKGEIQGSREKVTHGERVYLYVNIFNEDINKIINLEGIC